MLKDFRVVESNFKGKPLFSVQHRPIGQKQSKWRTYLGLSNYAAACDEMFLLVELDRLLPEG